MGSVLPYLEQVVAVCSSNGQKRGVSKCKIG